MRYPVDFGPFASGVPIITIWRDLVTAQPISGAPALDPLVSGITYLEYSGMQEIYFRAEIGSTYVAGTIDRRDTLFDDGEVVAVNHDYGGTDNLRLLELDSGEPIAGARIYAYKRDDFEANKINRTDNVIDETTTGLDGRWLKPLYLLFGDYTLFILKFGAKPFKVNIVVE